MLGAAIAFEQIACRSWGSQGGNAQHNLPNNAANMQAPYAMILQLHESALAVPLLDIVASAALDEDSRVAGDRAAHLLAVLTLAPVELERGVTGDGDDEGVRAAKRASCADTLCNCLAPRLSGMLSAIKAASRRSHAHDGSAVLQELHRQEPLGLMWYAGQNKLCWVGKPCHRPQMRSSKQIP